MKVPRRSVLQIMYQQDGAVLPIVGLGMVMLILAAGFAIDYTRAQIVQERLQWALDSAALAGSKVGSSGVMAVKKEAERYFKANFPDEYMGASRPQIAVQTIAGSFGAASQGFKFTTLDATVPNLLLKAVGWTETDVAAVAAVNTMPIGVMDIALSLDTSGSMLDEISGKVKLTEAKKGLARVVDALYLENSKGKKTRYSYTAWNQEIDKNMGLSSDKNAVKNKINEANDNGWTNGALGFGTAYSHIKNSDRELKALIMFTDGQNTAYGSMEPGIGSEAGKKSDAEEISLCGEAKSNGVRVYAIVYGIADPAEAAHAKGVMTRCASSPADQYVHTPDTPEALDKAFSDIISSLISVRLTQ